MYILSEIKEIFCMLGSWRVKRICPDWMFGIVGGIVRYVGVYLGMF